MAEKQYGQPTVVVGQAQMTQIDYTMYRAKVPAIILIVVAMINFIAFLTLGIMTNNFLAYLEFLISFGLYGLTGFLAAVGSFKQQSTQGFAVATIVFSVFSLILSFVQMIIRALFVVGGAAIVATSGDNDLAKLIGTVLLIVSGITLFLAILVFILCIVLMVFGSKVTCQCCGAPSAASGGVVYQAAPSAPQA